MRTMTRTALKALYMSPFLLGLLPITLWAQEESGMSRTEQTLLNIVLSDTTSRTACYLPSGYDFGSTEVGDGLREKLEDAMREMTKLRGQVQVVRPGSLPNDGKVIEDARSYQ